MATLPEGALMDRAATGLAYAVAGAARQRVRRPGAPAGRVRGQRRRRVVRRRDAGPAGAPPSTRQLLSPDQAHEAGLRAFRAAGGRVVDGAGRRPARRRGRRDRRHRRQGRAASRRRGRGRRPGRRPGRRGRRAQRGRRRHRPGRRSARARPPSPSRSAPTRSRTWSTRRPGPAARSTSSTSGSTCPPADVTALQAEDVARLLPVPEPTAHKYTRGVVGVRAGSRGVPRRGRPLRRRRLRGAGRDGPLRR